MNYKMGGGKIYLEWIDITKGIGILLVIMGHCIFPLHSIIDVFHMPLFFLIAGITFKEQSDISFLVGKTNRIIVPYCFWMILSSIISLIPHPYNGAFNGPLWFLQTIFISLTIMHLVVKLNKKTALVITVALLIISYLIVANDFKFLPFSLPRGIVGFLYIIIGYRFSSIIKQECHFPKLILIGLLVLCLFIISFGYLYKYYHLSGNFCSLSIYKHNFPIVFICSILGILLTICIAKIIKFNSFLSWFGKNSLVIMCVHFPVAQVLNVYIASSDYYNSLSSRGLAAVLEYIIVACFSYLCTVICRKFIPHLTGYKRIITT